MGTEICAGVLQDCGVRALRGRRGEGRSDTTLQIESEDIGMGFVQDEQTFLTSSEDPKEDL